MANSTSRKPRVDKSFARFPLIIKRSRIHGYGVFALKKIPARAQVIEYAGERIGLLKARRRYGTRLTAKRRKRTHLFRVSLRRVIDGAVGGSGAEIVNHSCDPNVRAKVRRGHVFYFNRRTIEPGEN